MFPKAVNVDLDAALVKNSDMTKHSSKILLLFPFTPCKTSILVSVVNW